MGPYILVDPFLEIGGGVLLSICGILGMISNKINSNLRLLSYFALILAIGIGMPNIASLIIMNPAVLPKALIASSAVFAGSSIFAYLKPKI